MPLKLHVKLIDTDAMSLENMKNMLLEKLASALKGLVNCHCRWHQVSLQAFFVNRNQYQCEDKEHSWDSQMDVMPADCRWTLSGTHHHNHQPSQNEESLL